MRRATMLALALLSMVLVAGCKGGGSPDRDDRTDPGTPDLPQQELVHLDQGGDPADIDPPNDEGRDAARETGDESPFDAQDGQLPGDTVEDSRTEGVLDDVSPDGPPPDSPNPADTVPDPLVDLPGDRADADPDAEPDADPDVEPDTEPDADAGREGTVDDLDGDDLPEADECRGDLDCEGKVSLATCQEPACDNGRCVARKSPVQSACDDGSKCTEDDACDADGECVGTLVVCADEDPCTTDTCDPASGCGHARTTGSCNDGDLCTSDDTCASGSCAGTPIDCNDNDVCTQDGCDSLSGCTRLPLSGLLCDDLDPCSTGDTCVNGKCKGTGGCDDGKECTTDTCEPGGGCSHENRAGSCNDGDPCSSDDHCVADACVGTRNCDDGNPCTTDECTLTGCVHRNNENGCDDQDPCTSGDTCNAGTCTGTPYTCQAGECETSSSCDGTGGCTAVRKADGVACTADASECTSDVCTAGLCTHPPRANGTTCNDGNQCTQTDACTDGVCVGANPVTCPQTDPCKAGSCDPSTGTCSGTAKPDNAPCDDNNRCTASDVCRSGVCTPGTSTVCSALDNCHDVGTCNHVTGLCSNPNKPDGSSCDDQSFCTRMDTCTGGVCVGSDPVICPAPNPCQEAGTCNPGTGACLLPTKPDGADCDDANKCTREDSCTAGQCAGTAYTCSDGQSCTVDACDGEGGCTFTVKANYCLAGGACRTSGKVNPANPCEVCTPALDPNGWSPNSGPCSDANACTKNDACVDRVCTGTAYSCDDGVECTDDTCDGWGGCTNLLKGATCRIDSICREQNASNPENSCQRCWPSTSTESWSGRPDGDTCTDGNLCTRNDACSAGVCGGTPYTCSDALDCTDDSCDGRGGCVFTPRTGFCLIAETCVPDGTPNPANVCEGCASGSEPNGWSGVREGETCDDSDPCTLVDTCRGGICVGGSSRCDDGIACTSDRCAGDGTCVNEVLAGWCMIDGTCHQAGERDASNSCLICDPALAVGTWTQTNGDSCSDSNECTLNDICVEGACAGTPMDCSDGLSCTDDTCSAGVCSHSVQADWCMVEGDGCFPNGAINPDNPCQKCDTTLSFGLWSANDGTCDDRISCTFGDTCVAGECKGTPYSCTDTLLCTRDACDGTGSCTHIPKPGTCAIGPSCWDAGDLNPDEPCMGCDPALDPGSWTARNGAPCDDDLSCTQADTCSLGQCVGTAYDCNDDLECTRDQCDGIGGCSNTLKGPWCLIAGTCVPDQSQKPDDPCLGCIASYLPTDWSPRDGVPCDDNQPCTLLDRCGSGSCHGAPYTCNDHLACTADACDGAGGCSNVLLADSCLIGDTCVAGNEVDPTSPCRVCTPAISTADWSPRNGVACNDGEGCSVADTCQDGACQGTAYSCDDGDSCTYDMCDGEGGCNNPLRSDVCRIDGTCWMAGDPRPNVACEACDPASNQFGWTLLNPNAIETCNGVDDNCDGITDPEGAQGPQPCKVYYSDLDRDGYGVTSDSKCLCAVSAPYFAEKPGDCDDTRPDVKPDPVPAPPPPWDPREPCDGVDNNCDGDTDPEGSLGAQIYYRDRDGDHHGDPMDFKELCFGWGTYTTVVSMDCNDDDPSIHLDAPELCDRKDNNCDTIIDPPDAIGCQDFYLDADGDGYGLNATGQCRCEPVRPYSATVAGDCDDTAATANPGRSDICNGVDDDCSGSIDDSDIDVLCPTTPDTPLHGTPYCSYSCRMNCDAGVDGEPGWNDADKVLKNGCECLGDIYDAESQHTCNSAFDLGILPDSEASTLIVDANLALPDRDDWYVFDATDPTWDAEPDGCDKFMVRVHFLVNPDNAYAVDIRRGDCEDASQICTDTNDAQWTTNLLTADSGECPCSTQRDLLCQNPTDLVACLAKEGTQDNCNDCPGEAAPGTHVCQNNSSKFHVRVYRKAGKPLTCDRYKLEISNGAYPGM